MNLQTVNQLVHHKTKQDAAAANHKVSQVHQTVKQAVAVGQQVAWADLQEQAALAQVAQVQDQQDLQVQLVHMLDQALALWAVAWALDQLVVWVDQADQWVHQQVQQAALVQQEAQDQPALAVDQVILTITNN